MAADHNYLARLGPLAQLAPYHIMIYGTLLGTELYQVSFREWLLRDPMLNQPELRDDQDMLPSAPHCGLHNSPEACIPRILPPAINLAALDSYHASASWSTIPSKISRRFNPSGIGRSYGGVEFVGIWAKDTSHDGRQDTSR